MTHRVVHIVGGKRVEQPKRPAAERNVEFMLTYCREHIPGFKTMHDQALASKGGTLPIGGKAK